jgi:hypothetical protein
MRIAAREWLADLPAADLPAEAELLESADWAALLWELLPA